MINIQSNTALYPTRPLECFKRMKELRRQIAIDTYSCRKKGKSLAMSGEVGGTAILGAFDIEVLPSMPTGAELEDKEWVLKLNEASEAQGYNRDCCAILRIAIGSQLMGTYGQDKKTKELLKPDFVYSMIFCQGQIKAHQVYAEMLGIPSIHIEIPHSDDNLGDFEVYLLDQFQEAVDRLEQLMGRKCDEEKLVEGVRNDWRCRLAMARIAELQKVVPAPIRLKNLISFGVFQWRGMTHRSDVADFYELALAEVKQRVADGIAGCGTERFRLTHEGTPPWYKNSVFSYPEKHGAPYTGSWTHFTNFGCFNVTDSWHLEVPRAPWERNIKINSRDSALKSLAELYMHYHLYRLILKKPEMRIVMARDWKIDGAVLALDRGCIGMTSSALESSWMLKQAGIPAITYEVSCANPIDFQEDAYQGLIDLLVEQLQETSRQ